MRTKPRSSATTATEPGIRDAVQDQNGYRWIRYGAGQQAIWFAVADLISNASEVFRRLSSVGVTCLTPASQSALKRSIEAHSGYREALVTSRPGWLEGFYVFGDGTFARPPSDMREVIVTFEPSQKFVQQGTLKEWQTAVAPFVAGQPLSHFVLALALSGPLLRLAPRGYLNPQVEIVGKGEVGKSGLGVLAASVWAGNPESDSGGGEIWDLTLNALDDVKLAHRDSFLFLDEGNLAGASLKERRDFVRQAVFKVATTGGKRRKGDAANGDHARLALLSTTNTALADLIEDSADVRDAAQSRMITIRITAKAPHGVFTSVPIGHQTALGASEALTGATDLYWGSASRAFITRLVREAESDEDGLRCLIASKLDILRHHVAEPAGSARVQKSLALAAVAATLARRWKVFPRAWGSPKRMLQAIAHLSSRAEAPKEDPIARINKYVKRHQSDLIKLTDLRSPLKKSKFEAAVGFLRHSSHGLELLVPAKSFQNSFPDYVNLVRYLRKKDLARTESGRKTKLTIKTPKKICDHGRVYCIFIKNDGVY